MNDAKVWIAISVKVGQLKLPVKEVIQQCREGTSYMENVQTEVATEAMIEVPLDVLIGGLDTALYLKSGSVFCSVMERAYAEYRKAHGAKLTIDIN